MSNIGDQLLSMGTGVVGNVINTGLGIMFGRSQEEHNDARQLRQQQLLQQQQIAGQKEMTDYNRESQMKMWNDTNWEAQIAHMKAAGINPALALGMGGGGGTTASLATGSVSSGEAPKGGHEQIDQQALGIQNMQNAMQLQLLKAQKENIEADTANKQADTGVKAATVPNIQAGTDLILQGIDNARNTYEIQKLDIAMKNIENYEKQATQADRMDYITYQAYIAAKQLQVIGQEQQLNAATMQDKIKIIRQQAIGAVLQNTLTQAQTGAVKESTRLTTQQIKTLANEIDITWENLSNEHRRIDIMQQLKDFNIDPNNKAIDQAVHALSGLLNMSILKYEPPIAPKEKIGFKY